jgi:hypothetical protein
MLQPCSFYIPDLITNTPATQLASVATIYSLFNFFYYFILLIYAKTTELGSTKRFADRTFGIAWNKFLTRSSFT